MYSVRMPKLDHMAEEGLMLAWHKKEGDQVTEGELLFEFESEKATEEVRAEASGTLLKVVAGQGETVRVSAIVGLVGEKGEEVPAEIQRELARAAIPAPPKRAGAAAGAAMRPRGKKEPAQVKVSPLARKLARDNNIDLEELKRSVAGSVVRREDIEAFIAKRAEGETAAAADGGDTLIQLTGVRKTMFERMTRVASTYAAITTIQKADVTGLVELKQGLSRSWEEEARPRYITFFVKAVSLAIRGFPILNSVVDEGAGAIRLRKPVNIGIAIDSQRGLIVPVLHDVPSLDLKALAIKTNALVTRAAANKLNGEDFRDGTFTITNAGPLGAYLNTPMINPPQSAILGTCSINEEPAVIDGKIVARKQMFLTLTYDHRIIQGAEAVGFLKKVVGLLEDPLLLL